MYVNGVSNRITAVINSLTDVLNGKLRFTNGSNRSTVDTTNITSNNTMRWPQPSGATTDDLLSRTNSATLFNKAISAWDNNLAGTMKFPSVRKNGTIAGGPVTGGGAGEGMLYGFIDMPAVPARGWDATFGSYWRYNTTTTANTPTGIRIPARWCLKEFLPYVRCKFRASSTASTRFYFGLSWQTQIPASDTPTGNSESCLLVGWRSTDTNLVIISNSGTTSASSTPSVTQTNVSKSSMSNQVRQMEILFTAANSCTVRIMDGNATQNLYISPPITSNLPQDAMSPSLVLSNTGTNSVDLDMYFEEMDQVR